MRTRSLISVGIVAAAAIAAGGCILTAPRSPSSDRLSAGNPLTARQSTTASPDSMPGPNPPPHPSPQPTLSVQFTGSDSVAAGQTSVTRWLFGNGGHSAITVAWTLADEQGWPGFPKQGTIVVAALGTQSLQVPVAVPDSTPTGFYPLHMTATAKGRTATADGGIRVFGGAPPPDTTGAGRR